MGAGWTEELRYFWERGMLGLVSLAGLALKWPMLTTKKGGVALGGHECYAACQ